MNVQALQKQFQSSSKKQADALAVARAKAESRAKERSSLRKAKANPPVKQTKKQLLAKAKEHNARVCKGVIRNYSKMRKGVLARRLGIDLA